MMPHRHANRQELDRVTSARVQGPPQTHPPNPVPSGKAADDIITRWRVMAVNAAGSPLGDALAEALELLDVKRDVLHAANNYANEVQGHRDVAVSILFGPARPPAEAVGKALKDVFHEFERVVRDGGVLAWIRRVRGAVR